MQESNIKIPVIRKDRLKFDKIYIQGFKTIDSEGQEIELKDVNVLIGANGSGKSNLINFFEMLRAIAMQRFQMFVGINGGAEMILHYGSQNTPTLSSELCFKVGELKLKYAFETTSSATDNLVIINENVISPSQNVFPKSGANKESEALFPNYNIISDDEKFSKGLLSNLLTFFNIFQFNNTSRNSGIKKNVDMHLNTRLLNDGSNIAAYLYVLKNKEEYKIYYDRIVSFLKLVIPSFDDFVLEPETLNESKIRLKWRDISQYDYIFDASQTSDGSLRIMILASLLLQPPNYIPSLIIIDEPELGLHPEALSVLATMIRMASEHTQIIIATQSLQLVEEFDPEDIIVTEWNRIKKRSEFHRLDKEELTDWLEDYSLGELWEKNVLGGNPK